MNCANQSIPKKFSDNKELKKEGIARSKFSLKSMCQDFSSEKSPLSFDFRRTNCRMIPLNLRVLGGRLREVRLHYLLFICWSYLRTPGQLKICSQTSVKRNVPSGEERGETAVFAGFDRVEKRKQTPQLHHNFINILG